MPAPSQPHAARPLSLILPPPLLPPTSSASGGLGEQRIRQAASSARRNDRGRRPGTGSFGVPPLLTVRGFLAATQICDDEVDHGGRAVTARILSVPNALQLTPSPSPTRCSLHPLPPQRVEVEEQGLCSGGPSSLLHRAGHGGAPPRWPDPRRRPPYAGGSRGLEAAAAQAWWCSGGCLAAAGPNLRWDFFSIFLLLFVVHDTRQ
jgi:hypothetical protein